MWNDKPLSNDIPGNAFHELRNVKLYPSVGMKKQPPVHLKANFGQEPFMFDIDGMVKVGIIVDPG